MLWKFTSSETFSEFTSYCCCLMNESKDILDRWKKNERFTSIRLTCLCMNSFFSAAALMAYESSHYTVRFLLKYNCSSPFLLSLLNPIYAFIYFLFTEAHFMQTEFWNVKNCHNFLLPQFCELCLHFRLRQFKFVFARDKMLVANFIANRRHLLTSRLLCIFWLQN